MKQVFDYLENVDFAATVCDSDGIVVYQNAISRNNDGDVMGKNLYKCHGSKSGEKIRHMIDTGHNNTYEIINPHPPLTMVQRCGRQGFRPHIIVHPPAL